MPNVNVFAPRVAMKLAVSASKPRPPPPTDENNSRASTSRFETWRKLKNVERKSTCSFDRYASAFSTLRTPGRGSSVGLSLPRRTASSRPTRVSRVSVGGMLVSAPPHRRSATDSESPTRSLDVDSTSKVITYERARRSPVAGSESADATSAICRISEVDRVTRSARVNSKMAEAGAAASEPEPEPPEAFDSRATAEPLVDVVAAIVAAFVAAFVAASSSSRPATVPAMTLPPDASLVTATGVGCMPRFAWRMSATALRSSSSPCDAPPSSWRTTSTTVKTKPLLRVAASTASRSVASCRVMDLSSSGRSGRGGGFPAAIARCSSSARLRAFFFLSPGDVRPMRYTTGRGPPRAVHSATSALRTSACASRSRGMSPRRLTLLML
mmetsp:Transcript_5777/g.24479  ORF Transcript_5777/g.24479 Transcript_5777/m.24479 type:complete len:384 (+) Transcript_5777:631-1782(+)